MFSPNTFLARLRPKEYKQVPESTLNATLKDVHDLVQYLAVQIQRVIWGQDLGKTFGVRASSSWKSLALQLTCLRLSSPVPGSTG